MARVIDELRQDHRNHNKLLDILERQIVCAYAEDSPDYDLVAAIVDYFLSYSAQFHHPREDAVYARLLQRDASAAAEVGDLESEHETCKAHLRAFSSAMASVLGTGVVSRQAFTQAALGFTAAQRIHMTREELVFFPTALRVLQPADWAELDLAFRREPDPLFESEEDRRWRSLRNAILTWNEPDGLKARAC